MVTHTDFSSGKSTAERSMLTGIFSFSWISWATIRSEKILCPDWGMILSYAEYSVLDHFCNKTSVLFHHCTPYSYHSKCKKMCWGYITQALLSCDDLCFHKNGYKIPSYQLSSLKTAMRHHNSLVFLCTSRAESNTS